MTLEAKGAPVPAHVTLDPSGMILTIAPQIPEAEVTYTAVADTLLAALDGRSIRNAIRVSLTVPAQILLCSTDDDERLSQLEITFETTPGDWVAMTMSREADDVPTVQMELSNGAQFSNNGSDDDGWHFRLEGGRVSAQAHVGRPGEQVRFSKTGECSSRWN